MTLPRYAPVQIAYHVQDIESAAKRMHDTFGAGPFFVNREIQLSHAIHRGEACLFVHSSAYGQWGELMLELVQQEDDGPSPFRDMYAKHESGIHHIATIVPDQRAAYAAYQKAGFEVATIAQTTGGTQFAFIDTLKQTGHFVEVYEEAPVLRNFYNQVRVAALNWQGQDLLRDL